MADRLPPLVAADISSGRLDLEPLRVDHAAEMAPLLGDVSLYNFIGGDPPSAADVRSRYERQVVGSSADGSQRWLNWVVRLRVGHTPIGYVQATVSLDRMVLRAESAWVVGTAHQGRGYAKEAVTAMAQWLRRAGVQQLFARVHPEHAASAAVARAARLAPTDEIVDGEIRWTTDN